MKTQNIKAHDFENRAMSGLKVFAGRVLSLVLILSLLFNSIAVDGEAMPRLRFVRAEGVLEARLDEMEVALGGDEDDDAQEHVYSYVFSGAQTRLSDVLWALALPIDTHMLTLDAIGLGGTGEDMADDPLAIPNDPIAVRPTDDGDFIITPLRPFDEARITIDTPEAACVIRLETLPDTVWDIPMEAPADEVEYQLIHDSSETEYEPQWTLPPEMETETEAADAIESQAIEPFMEEAADPELPTDPEPAQNPDTEQNPNTEQNPDPEPNPEPQTTIVVTITGHNSKIVYDGEEHSVEGYDVSISDPLYTEADFTFTGAASAEGTDVGKTAMGLSAEMFENINSDFTDVTFVVTDGFLIVAQELTITAGSMTRTYNGKPLTEHTYTAEGLLDGHKIEGITFTGEQTNVGTVENVPSEARIVDADDADVTELYEIAYVNGTLTVEQAVVTVSPNDMKKVYGDEDPALTVTVTGLAEGESPEVLSYTLNRAPGEDVTEYPITVTGETEQGNYLVTYDEDPATFTIDPAPLTVTAVNTAKVYGEPDPAAFTATVSGLKFNDAPSLIAYTVERDEGEDVGAYDITPDGLENQGNYVVQYIEGTFTITPARAVVTAADATKVYGEDDPEYQADITGLAGDDTAADLDFDFARAAGEDVGDYALTPVGAEVQGNYVVEYVGAVLTITRAEAIVRPEALEKVYGEVDPELTIEVEGLQNDDDASVITCTLTRAEGENVGTYAVTATGEAEQGNYNLTYEPGEFTITRATVTVTPDGIEKTYGSADPETLTASIDGLLNEDDKITYTVTRETGEGVGNYVLTATGAAQQGNYQVSFETGEFTIAPRPITVSVIGNSAMSVYDGESHQISGYELEITDDSETPLMDDKYIYKKEYVAFEGSAVTEPLTDVGEAYMGLNEGQFANTNDNYAVVFAVSDGIQYVSHRTVQVTITGNHAEFNYDSLSHSVEGYTATIGDETDNALYDKVNIVNHGEAVATRAESGRTGMGLSAGQFANIDPNFDVAFTVVDGYIDIMPIEITVSITGNRGSYVYDGEAHTVKGYVASSERLDLFDSENVVFTGVDEVSLIDAGEAPMGLHADDFAYDDPNVKATFQITDGSVTITPMLAVVVTIEGNHDALLYDGEAHTVIGYTATADTPLYDVDTDIALTGEASATRTEVGTNYMGLQASQFSNTNPNFESVVFTIGADGYMTISPNSATVTITGNRVTAAYNGQPQSITGFTARADTPLYDVDGEDCDFTFSGAATATRTDAGTTAMSLSVSQFQNKNPNFRDVVFEIDDGFVEITPIPATVTITGHSGRFVYDGAPHTVQGYEVEYSTPLYNENCFRINGQGSVTRTEAGVSEMRLSTDSFENISTNFVDVDFIVTDGAITIDPAIVVGKYLNNELAEAPETFTFHVVLEDDQGEILPDYQLADGIITDAEGKATFTLTAPPKDRAYQTLGIPLGGSLSVEEDKTNDPNNYITTVLVNGAEVEASSYELDYVLNSPITLEFVNAKGNVCRIDDEEFQTIASAIKWAVDNGETEISIQMLVDYTMPPSDIVTIPSDMTVTLITAPEYDGTGAATISRANVEDGYAAAMFTNHGTLNIADAGQDSRITLDGGHVNANAAMIVSDGTVNVYGGGTLQNAVNIGDGGAINGGSVNVFGGEIKDNRAQNGGAIFTDNGTVNVSGGSMSGNSASGVGGAVCTASGGVTVSGGMIGGTEADEANTAVNGSAIFVGTGNGSFSGGEITGNVATEGGAVGFSSENARLSFSGVARITGNTMGDVPSNVYLNVDTDLVINNVGLELGAEIGVHVPGTGALYENRGVSGVRFGGYTGSAVNLNSFKSDRTPGMTVIADNFKMMWGRSIAVEIWQVTSISATNLPPVVSGSPNTGEFFPTTNENYLSDVATAIMMDPTLGGVSSGYTFACAFGKGATSYDECLSMLNWNDQTGDWGFVDRTGQFVTYPNDPPTLMIFYSTPAYITLANNTEYPLDITSLTVNGIDAALNAYGFVVAREGATVEHFVPLAASDLDLDAGESIKLMFPGARNRNYTLNGVFKNKTDAEAIPCINYHSGGEEKNNISAPDAVSGFSLGGRLFNDNSTAEVSFGTATMICKIVELNADGTVKEEHTYSTLQNAVSRGDQYYDAYKVRVTDPFDPTVSYDTVKIEMIQDYLIPADDQPNVPTGRNFTFTTATRENGSLGEKLYTGVGNRATISQDQGKTNSFIKESTGGANTALTVENLNFEGKQLDATKTNGGVISTMNCSLTVRNVRFTNFSAGNGGALFAQFGGDATAYNSTYAEANNWVRIANAEFDTCASKANVDRLGGGAIWTNAKTLTMSSCTFTNCTATQQGGAVYHRIDDNYSFARGSSTVVNGCHFLHCWANAAGGLEINAYQVTIDGCEFDDCQAKTRNGGGFNAYLRAPGTTGTQLTISNSTFNNCFAKQDGGVFRTQMNTTVINCTFTNNTANAIKKVIRNGVEVEEKTSGGGGIAQDNGNLLILDHCVITGNKSGNMGGGVYTNGNLTLMNDCVITGNSLTTNNVANGAGLYLVNGKTLTLGAEGRTTPDTCTISNNLAADGSASNLRLPEKSGSENSDSVIVRCNFTTGADEDKLIHVLNANKAGTTFGTSNVSLPKGFTEMEHIFVADNNALYGVYDRTNGTGIMWRGELICKLTDGSGRLLFFDAAHTDPAVFEVLDNSSNDPNKATAFGVLKYGRDDITLYYDDGTPYNAANRTYCVEMLVDYTTEKYLSTKPANLSWQTVILTTAGSDDALYPYRGAEGTFATITRGTGVGNNNNLLRVFVNMTLRDITLDGNASKITPNTNTRLITTDLKDNYTTAVVTLASGATLQNAHNTGNGAGVMLNWGGSLVIDGGRIVNCVANGNGGAVYKDGGNGEFTFIDGEISGCSASIGGALYINKHNDGKRSEMRGGVITGCSATTGGAVFVANGTNSSTIYKFYMSGGSITGNQAGTGGGIAVGGTNTRLYFSGDAVVYGNKKTSDADCNVELNYNSDAVINTTGNGLGEDALIGVYVATNIDRNDSGKLFGTRPNSTGDGTLKLFINDRNALRGAPVPNNAQKIRWEKLLSLQVTKTVVSDLSADRQRPFTFKVTLKNEDGTVSTAYDDRQYGLGRSKLTFAQGVATFTLKHGEMINVVGMPEGVNYAVEEIAGEGENPPSDDFSIAIRSGNQEYNAAEFLGKFGEDIGGNAIFVQALEFKNTRRTNSLSIAKTVTDEDAADRNQEFNFTLELQTGLSFALNGQYGGLTINNNTASFTLKHGQSVTASGLPTGITYTVTEREKQEYRQSVAVNGETVQAARNVALLPGENANAVVFTNTRKVGGVKVTMEVKSDAAADKNIDFPVSVTLSDRTINGTFGEMEFVNGVASFTLKHGQSITATKLRQGLQYSVSQSVSGFDPKYIYTDSMGRTDSNRVIGTDISNCAITNTRSKGKLQIKKQLVTDRTRDNATFTFTVRLGNTVDGEFVVDTGITNKYGTVNFTNGVSEPVAIIGAASKTISNLPQGIEYQVIEAASDHFELTASQNATGVIGASTSVATFTNTRRTGKLIIEKTVVSDAAQDKEKDFHFTIRLGDAISKTYDGVSFSGGTAYITLKHGQRKTISGLPTDVGYTVAETSVSGFTVQSEGHSGTIGIEDSVAHFTNTREVGNLTVKKQVHSDLTADANEAFSFTVQLGSLVQNRFTVDESINGTYGGMTFTNGVANFTLSSSDEPVTAVGLPAELRYLVTEATDSDFNTTSTGANGAISVTRPATATFTNTRRTGTLKLTKNVVSDVSADKNHTYTFTIRLGHDGEEGFVTDTNLSKKYGSVTFANGVGTVALKPTSGTASVTMSGIPQGVDYVITEAPADYMIPSATGDTGTISAARESNAIFTNTRQVGDLTVSKELRGYLTTDSQIDFQFTVRLGSVSQTYAAEYADGRTKNVKFTNGEATFTLKGGEALTIHGLPAAIGYTVIEAANSDFDTTKTGDKGTIIADDEMAAAFTNTRKIGDLRLTKRVVSDLAGDNEREFTFTVTVTGADINGDYGDLTFEDGVATVTLSKDQSVTARGLPTKLDYAIAEASVPGFTTTTTNATGKIAAGRIDAAFTNTRDTGDLTVSKALVSDLASDASLYFNYKVTLSDASIGAVTPDTPNGKTFGGMVFKNGVSTFSLRGGQSAKAQGLPAGISYTVEEVNASDDFTCAVKLNGTTVENASGLIVKNAPATVAFTNTRKTGALQISKDVVSNRSADLNATFKFTVTLNGLSNTARNKSYSINGGTGSVTLKNGSVTISLKNGERMTIEGLPSGASYKVSEKLTTAQTADFATDPANYDREGTIVESPLSVAAFTNTRKTGHLTITKLAYSDLASDRTFQFPFTVTLNDTTINNTYITTLVSRSGNITTSSVKFTKGASPTLYVRDGESLTIMDLPTDARATVKEALTSAQKKNYVTVPASYASTAVITLYGVSMTFENTRKVGDLKVSKTIVSDVAKDTEAEFDFLVTLADNTISKTYALLDQDGNAIEGGVTFANGVATLRMKHGESRTIKGLPRELRYTVTEPNPGALYTTQPASVTGTINDTSVASAVVRNVRKTGTLVVTKRVENALSKDATRLFSFNVKVGTVVNGNFVPEPGVNRTYGDVTFRNGEASFILTQDASKSISGLPVGLDYIISETATPATEFEPVSAPVTGVIVEGSTPITFTNTRKTGTLTVSKAVVSERALDAQRVFHFTVTADDTIINGNYGGLTFTNGIATFDLKGGESVTAEGLPVTLGFTVTEDADAGFTTESVGATGSISTTPSAATFTNTRKLGDLKVVKAVESDLATDANQLFDFTVTLDDATLSKTYGDMTFVNGVAKFQLKDGESLTAVGLPTEVAYTVSEAPATGFITASDQQGIIIEGTSTVTVTNTRETGALKIEKVLNSDLAADATRPFTFTVTLTGLTDAAKNKTFGGVPFTDGAATVELTGGESLTIDGLPTGAGYTVAETLDSDFTTAPTSASGTIVKGTVTRTFTNTRKPGTLEITKALVSDLAADSDVEFAFTLTLTGLTDAAKNKTYSDIKFTDGVGTFRLKGGETKRFTDLPTGVAYSVTEASVPGFITESTGATGTISATPSTAAFTNTREVGDLTVSKAVVSDLAADASQTFDFTVTLGDTTISKTYGDMSFTNGVATFSLKGGEYVTAIGLPTTLTYTVTEAANDDFITAQTGATGAIQRDIPQTAAFTNTRKTGELEISKAVVSERAEDAQKPFTFTVTVDGLTDTAQGKTFGDVQLSGGAATFTLTHGGKKLLSGLPTGATYAVTETPDADFATRQTGDTGAISTDKSEARFTNIRRLPITLTVADAMLTYNGQKQSGNATASLTSGTLRAGHALSDYSYAPASGTNAGTYDNGALDEGSVVILDGDENVTDQYIITFIPGKLTITPKPVTITTASDQKEYDGTALTNSEANIEGLVNNERATLTATGTITEVGSTDNTYDIDWGDTNKDNYKVTDVLGVLTITKNTAEVTLTAASDSKTYDGTALTNGAVTFTGLPNGFTIEATASGSQTDAGESDNVVNDGYVIKNPEGGDRTANFINIRKADGKLTVNPKPVTITTGSDTKEYDGAPLTNSDASITGLVEGETATVTATGTITNVGKVDNVYSITWDKAKAQNYTVTDALGTLTVTPKSVTVTAVDDSKTYGDADPAFKATVDGLVGEDSITYSIRRDAGELVNENGYAIIPSGEPTQGNYQIEYVPGRFTIIPKPITITADSDSKVYDGTPLTKKSYANTALAQGDSIASVTVTGSQTIVGTSDNIPGAAVIKRGETDVTSCYDITYAKGELEVTPKALTITADSDSKIYDGTPLANDSYTNTALAQGDSISSVTVTGSQTVVGSSDNVPGDAKIVNGAGEDVTTSYKITYKNGQLTVRKKDLTITADSDAKVYDGEPLTNEGYKKTDLAEGDRLTNVTVTGSQTIVGTCPNVPGAAKIVNAADEDVTECYNITYVNGTLEVTPKSLTITADSAEKVYDGTPLTKNSKDSYTHTELAEGDKIENITIVGSQKDVGSSANMIGGGAIVDADGKDVTLCYDITYVNGTLTVTPRKITITAASDTKIYDGSALANDGYTCGEHDLADGDEIISCAVNGSQTVVGTSENKPGGVVIWNKFNVNVTGNYDIEYVNGSLEVTPKALTITADSDAKEYDGMPLMKDSYVSTALVEGDAIESVKVVGSQTNVGSSDNVPGEAKIVNAEKEDVTSCYNISYEKGTLTVTGKPVTITADSDTKVYDGTPLMKDTYTHTALVEGQSIAGVTVTGSQTDVGATANTPSDARIVDKDGEDVTSNYKLTYADGTLTVNPRPVTITTGSDTKEYDGTALTNSEASITGLVEGESVTLVATGTITELGNTPNTYSISWDSANADNYTVTEDLGTLTITENTNEVILTAASDSKIYDGTALTNGAVTFTGLPNGFTVEATASGSQTDAGESDNVVNDGYVIKNPEGGDRTANFTNIRKVNGKLTIYPKITVTKALIDPLTPDENLTFTFTPKFDGVEGESFNILWKDDEHSHDISVLKPCNKVTVAELTEAVSAIYDTRVRVFANDNEENVIAKETMADNVWFTVPSDANTINVVFTNERKKVPLILRAAWRVFNQNVDGKLDFTATLTYDENPVRDVELIEGHTTNKEGKIEFAFTGTNNNQTKTLMVPVGATIEIVQVTDTYRTNITEEIGGEWKDYPQTSDKDRRYIYTCTPETAVSNSVNAHSFNRYWAMDTFFGKAIAEGGSIGTDHLVEFMNYNDAYLKLENLSSNDYAFRIAVKDAEDFVRNHLRVFQYTVGGGQEIEADGDTNYYCIVPRNNETYVCLFNAAGSECEVTLCKRSGEKWIPIENVEPKKITLNNAESSALLDSKLTNGNTLSGTLVRGPIYDVTKVPGDDEYKLVSIIDALSFKKINGFGEPLGGATFTLFIDKNDNDKVDEGEAVGTQTSVADDDPKTVNDGIVTFAEGLSVDEPYKLVETVTPDDFVKNENVYDVTYTKGSGFKIMRGENELPKLSSGEYVILNVYNIQRKVILKKVDADGQPVPDMAFQLRRYDGTIVDGAENLTSSPNGLIWIGMLPLGTYYLYEREKDSENWNYRFKVNVETTGVTVEERLPNRPES